MNDGGDNQRDIPAVLQKQEWYMGMAMLTAQRSKDPRTQVGCAIVNAQGIIVSLGYNGMPTGCQDDKLPWTKASTNILDTKFPYVVHAEANSVLNAGDADVAHCVLYTTLFPCKDCTKVIIQARIKHVVYYIDKSHDTPSATASRRMLDMAGISYEKFTPPRSKIEIHLTI